MDTNPNGSAKTVSQAADAFSGLMGGEEAQAQPEPQEVIEEVVEQVEVEEELNEDTEEYEEPEEEQAPTYRVKVG